MAIIIWITIGFSIGFMIKKYILSAANISFIMCIFLGLSGSLIGGYISAAFGWGTLTRINLISVLASSLGAILILLFYYLLSNKPHSS